MGIKTTRAIAEWIYNTTFKDISTEVIDYAKILALSHFGMTLAGSVMPFGEIIIDYIKQANCQPESGVIGGRLRTLAEYAALANGTLAHTTELEDDSFPDGLYSCGAWPAVLALGEKLHTCGKDVLEAFIIGYEVASRIGLASLQAVVDGHLNAAGCLTIGSAAMAAKLMNLNVEDIVNALSIASSQAQGIARQTGTGAHLIEAGFTGRNGLCAATLAKLGYTGNPTILEGRGGFLDLWAKQPDFDLALGDGFRVMDVGIKKYPCCYLQQRNIDGVLDLIAEHNIKWEDVETVEHEINQTVSLYLKYSQPETGEDARFSLEHSTVACFFDHKVFLESYTDEKAKNTDFKEARKKVIVTVHPEWPGGYFSFNSPVTIRLKNRRQYSKVCVNARGDPSNRLTVDEVMQKYLDCIDFARALSHNMAEKAAEMILQMDAIDDVEKLVHIFTFPDR